MHNISSLEKPNIFIYVIFLLSIFLLTNSISNILLNNYFNPQNTGNISSKLNTHERFHNMYKNNTDEQAYRKASEYDCKINNNLDERQHLRWVFKYLWKKAYDFTVGFFGETKFVFDLYKLLIATLIFSSYLCIISLFDKKKYFKKIIIPITSFFLIILLLSASSHISEINFSILEFFFISLSFFLILKKKFIPFIFLCILAPLNRETGFILPIIYLIIYPTELKKFLFLSTTSVAIYFLANVSPIQCIFTPGFLFSTNPIYETFSDFSFISKLKILFQDYFLYIVILVLFWNKNILQKKFLIIFSIYFIAFIVGTPFQHSILRILLIPTIMLYISVGIASFNKISK